MKRIKLNSNSQYLIYASVIAIFTIASPLLANENNISNLKNEIADLQEILFNPKNNQIAVLVSLDAKKDFVLKSVSFYLDDKKTKTYLYTERESDALINNSTQKIYIGDISEGEHTIKAQLTATGANKKDYTINSTTSKITKSSSAKYVEFQISKSEQQDLPAVNIKIWE